MTTLQIGRRLAVVLVVVTILSSTGVGFSAATTDTTSATQLDENESAEAVTTQQSITEVATTVEQVGTTSADVTTGVEVTSTPATTEVSPDETASTEVQTSTEPATEPVTTTVPTTTSAASDPTTQESAVETSEASSNELIESASESTEQSTDEPVTSTEATVTETPTEAPLEATTEVPSVENSTDTSVTTSVEADADSTTTNTVDESTTGEQSAVPTATDDVVDSESATTVVSNSTDAVPTVEEGEEIADSNESVVSPLTDSAETTQPDVDDSQSVADTTVPTLDDSPESVQTAGNVTETPTSVVDTGDSLEEPTGSVTTDQTVETVTAPVDTSGGDEDATEDAQSTVTTTIGDSVDTVESEIENEQVDDANATAERAGDVATDTADNTESENETFEPSVEPIDETTDLTSNETTENSLDSAIETIDDADEDAEQVVEGVEDDAVTSSNETGEGTVEPASNTVTKDDTNTLIDPLFEKSVDETNISSISDSSVVTSGSDQESTLLADASEFESVDEVADESVEATGEAANGTVNSTESTITGIDANATIEPTVEESVNETVSTTIDDSEALGDIANETTETTDETVDETADSTVNTVESADTAFEDPVGEVSVSSIGDSTVETNDSDDLTTLDADEFEPVEEGSNELADVANETVDETIDTSTNTVAKTDTNAMPESTVEELANGTVSATLDGSVAVVNESGDEFTSLDAIDGPVALENITNESIDTTAETVNGATDSTTNAVTSIDSAFEEPADVNLSSSDDATVVTNEPGEEPVPLDEIGDFEPLEEVSNESTDVTDETGDGTIGSTANTVESIEPTLDEPADEVTISSISDSSVVTNDSDDELTSLTAVGGSDSFDGVVDQPTVVTDQTNNLSHILENDVAEDEIGTTDETTNVAADSTANVIESAEPLFEDSDDATVASLDDSLTVTDGSDDEFTSLDSVGDSLDVAIDEPTAINGQTDELTSVLESDAVEGVTGTTNDVTRIDLDGSVDSLVQLEEIVSDTAESSTVTTDVESRTTDLVVAGTEAASETLGTGDSLVTEADGTIDDGTESAGELTDVRIEPLDETVYATDDLTGTVEDTDRIVSDFDSIDATADVERVGVTEAEISVDGTVEGTVGDITVETSERFTDPTDQSIDGTLTEAEQTTGRIVASVSTVDDGAATFEVDEATSAPSSQDSTPSVGLVRAVDVDGRTPVVSSRPESVADPIESKPTAAVPHAGAGRTGGAITTAETVRDRSVEWANSPNINSKLHGDHSVARSTDDDSAAGPAIDSGQSNRPVGGESSPLDESESKAVLGLGIIAVGAAAGRFAGNASSLQAALNPSMVQLQLRAGVHSIQCWCDRFSFPGIGPIPGYSRYDDSDPLENEIRAGVYESIEGSPGVYLTRLSEESAVPRSTVRYHVRILESEGLISAVKVRGRRRFFLADSDEIQLATALSDDATAAVLDAVAQLGPASGSKIAERLDRDPSTASHHLKRLSEAGLVVREREGGAVLNRLSPTARETLTASDLRSAPREAKA